MLRIIAQQRLLLWGSILVWLATACAGCSSPTPPLETVTITFACLDHEREHYEGIADDFQAANPDVQVQFVSANEASGLQSQGGVITSDKDTNPFANLASAADTFVWYSWRVADGVFSMDLQPFLDNDPKFPVDDFYPGLLEHFRWQGKLYGLPAETTPLLIFYDKEMFDEAGVAYPEIEWTWDDFVSMALQLTQRQGDTIQHYGFVDSYSYLTLHSILAGEDIRLWDARDDPARPLLDAPEVADAVRRYTDLVLLHSAIPPPELGSGHENSDLINQGRAAMWTEFAPEIPYYAQRASVGIVPFPTGVVAANPQLLRGFYVSAGTAHPDAAWRWLTYLSDHYQPWSERIGALPARRSVGKKPGWWKRLSPEARDAVDFAISHPLPDNPLNYPWGRFLRDIFEVGTSVEEALTIAQAQLLAEQAELAATPIASPPPIATPQLPLTPRKENIVFAPYLSIQASTLRSLADRFHQAYPDITVEIATGVYYPYEGVDCFATLATLAPALVEMGQIRNLSPLAEADPAFDPDDFYPQALRVFQVNGELRGLPYELDALLLYANTEHLSAAGLDLPPDGWTLDEFLTALDCLADKLDEMHYAFTTREGIYGDRLFLLQLLGGQTFTAGQDGPSPTLNDPSVVAALGQAVALARNRQLTPETPSESSGWPLGSVLGPHPAYVSTAQVGLWVDQLSDHLFAPPLDFPVVVAPLPEATEFQAFGYFIATQTVYPDACWTWITFLSRQSEAISLLPAHRSLELSPRLGQATSETEQVTYRATLALPARSIFRWRFDYPWLAYIYPWIEEAWQSAMSGGEPAMALGIAQTKAETYIDCLGQRADLQDETRWETCFQAVEGQ